MGTSKQISPRTKGSGIVELAAAIVLLFPLLVILTYVTIEAAQAYTITSALAESAERAARQLAINYGQDSDSTMANPNSIFNQIKYLNIVNDQRQFSIPTGGWNTNSNPPTVTVVCTYQSGQHGAAPFPNPDPLNLSSAFVLSAQSTCRLE